MLVVKVGCRKYGPSDPSTTLRVALSKAEGREARADRRRGWAAFAKAPASFAEASRRRGPAAN
jgi:hypothetical protein